MCEDHLSAEAETRLVWVALSMLSRSRHGLLDRADKLEDEAMFNLEIYAQIASSPALRARCAAALDAQPFLRLQG